MTKIKTLRVLMPYKLGSVNCYLIDNGANHILVDTGSSHKRIELEQELENAGCKPGNLELIVLTHGDFDHTGNASHLRNKFGAQVAMHKDDAEMVERGDMFANRKQPHFLIRKLINILSGFGTAEKFKPDIFVEDGYDLMQHGFDANILSLPGHSKGSLGILMADGDLICGDLFENHEKPSLNSIMDDPAAAISSLERLKKLEINTVYPGHGKPFLMKQFTQANR